MSGAMKNRSVRRVWGMALVLLAGLGGLIRAQEPSSAWNFEPPDEGTTGPRLLDLRFLNEAQSGEQGFIRLSEDGNSFVRGDGEPIRFWACGSTVYRQTPEEMDRHCRFLARLGVNMVRLHATVASTKEGAEITDVNRAEIDGIFRFIQAAKANGIYLTISPYYGHHNTPASWGLEGYAADQMPWGAIFIDPRMQEGYRAWTRELYTTVNPHTGLAIRDDPTVAILQVHNEDSLLFWTAQRLPAPQQQRLARSFGQWLQQKYGPLAEVRGRWARAGGSGAEQEGDDIEQGVVALLSTWHLTQDWQGATAARLQDQTEFLAEYQREFYAGMGRYLREELGCRQLLNATNWRTADDLRLKALERYSYAALDCDAENEYYGADYQHIGENDGYRIDPDHYLVDESCLHKPLELTTNFSQQPGHPFLVTETSWKHPNLYQSEGPFLIAAYQSLGGVDVVYWFDADVPTWQVDPRYPWWNVRGMNPLRKWSCSTPMLMGMFPANALLYRRGYLQPGDVVVRDVRSRESMFRREPALVDDSEIYGVSRETAECAAMRLPDGRLSRAAFLVGQVQSVLGGEPEETRVSDFSAFLDAEGSRILSSTRELSWDYGQGICEMDAPRAQGVTGFLQSAGGRFELSDVAIESRNPYATVQVVSLDGDPLASSGSVLVQVGTTARLTGWETRPAEFEFRDQTMAGEQIVNTGAPPWRIADTQVTLTIRNPRLRQARQVNAAGVGAGEVAVRPLGENVTLTLPPDAQYVVLSAGE